VRVVIVRALLMVVVSLSQTVAPNVQPHLNLYLHNCQSDTLLTPHSALTVFVMLPLKVVASPVYNFVILLFRLTYHKEVFGNGNPRLYQ